MDPYREPAWDNTHRDGTDGEENDEGERGQYAVSQSVRFGSVDVEAQGAGVAAAREAAATAASIARTAAATPAKGVARCTGAARA
jgi:hypothetical protein